MNLGERIKERGLKIYFINSSFFEREGRWE